MGDEANWTLEAQLQAAIADALNVANWQRGSGKKADYPDPIARPGVNPVRETTAMTPAPRTIAEIDAFLTEHQFV